MNCVRTVVARGVVIAIALIAFMGARVSWAGESTDCLGSALAFSLFSFAQDGDIEIGVGNAAKVSSSLCFLSGEIGAGGDIALGNNGLYTGDVVSFGAITLNNYAKVMGTCATNGGPVTRKTGATCGSTDTSGTNSLLGLADEAYFDGGAFACDVSIDSPTQSLPAVVLGASKKFTISDTVTGGLNLIDVPSMALGNSSTLTLWGGATDTLVLRIDGNTTIGSGAKIVLAGGLTPFQVVIAAQGGISAWGNSTTINGTMLVGQPFNSADRACPVGSGATINGALLCEDDLSMGPNPRVNYLPAFQVHVPDSSSGTS